MFLVCGILRDYLYHMSMFLPCCRLQVSCRRKLRVLFKPSGTANPVMPTAQDLPLKQQRAQARLETLGKKQVMCVVSTCCMQYCCNSIWYLVIDYNYLQTEFYF